MGRPGRRIRRTALLVFFAAFTYAGALAPAALAADSAATCSLDISLYLRPGLTLTSSTGSIGSSDAGRLNCIGVIDGGVANGPGEFRVFGTYSGRVLLGTTTGQASYSIPTNGGPKGGTVRYSVLWVGSAGFITLGDPVYGNAAGPFAFLPTGNGITRPVTMIRWVSQQLTFGSGAPAPPS
jgi:hypothetical protein